MLVATFFLNPFQGFWVNVYERFHLYQLWPLALWIAGACFSAAGFARHRRSGLPQHFPWSAIGATLFLLLVTLWILATTAVDWSVGWSLFALLLLAIGLAALIPGFLGYTELWRILCSSPVAKTVEHALQDGSFTERVQRQIEGKSWGSLHCLRVVQGEYDSRKLFALEEILVPASGFILQDGREAGASCLQTGDDLRLYLSMRWPEVLASATEREWRRTEVLRHLLTLSLEEGYRQYSGRIEAWMSELDALLKDPVRMSRLRDSGCRPFLEFIQAVFLLGKGTSQKMGASAIGRTVRGTLALSRQLPDKLSVPAQNSKYGLAARAICAQTWLALADRSLPPQAVFDAWMAMTSGQGADLMVGPPSLDEPENIEPSQIAALCWLTEWYEQWQGRTHPDWSQGLAGKARHVSEALR
jgi:hypothetical protein